NAHPNIVPYDVFPVADGHVIIASGNDGQYRKLCAAIGAEALAENPDYATNRGRVAHRAALVPALAAHTARLGKAELLARLEAAGVPAGPINGIDEVFADPQVIHRGLRLDLVHGEAEGGHVPGLRTPILIDGRPQASARPAPMLGEHSQDVLSDPNWKKA
ncbi:MAG: CoA transferase, partial [Rhabdaerophilum calidifontis]